MDKKAKIPTKVAVEAKGLYVAGASLSEICRRFPAHTRDQLRHLKETEHWEDERFDYKQELENSANDDLSFAKVMLRDSIATLARRACERIRSGEIEISSVRDIEKLAEITGLLAPKDKPPEPVQLTQKEVSTFLTYIARRKGIPLRQDEEDEQENQPTSA